MGLSNPKHGVYYLKNGGGTTKKPAVKQVFKQESFLYYAALAAPVPVCLKKTAGVR